MSTPDTVPGAKAKIVNGHAVPPKSAPARVKKVIAAANQIDDKPYIYGGGHGKFKDKGYDCSGAVSYALHGGKFVSSPMPSTGYMKLEEARSRKMDHRLLESQPRLHGRRRTSCSTPR